MIINTDLNKKKKNLEEIEELDTSNNKPIKLLILCIILIISILLYALYLNYRNNFNYLKIDKNEHIVYTRYNKNKNEIPYINIKSSDVDLINEKISQYCEQYLNNDATIKYQYHINGNYLTVVIKVLNMNTGGMPKFKIDTYNVNLKTRNYVSNEELLRYFNVTEAIVSDKINKKMKDYYNEEISQNYFSEETCDFNCYLGYRGITNYLDDVTYGIKNGKLYAYRPFTFTSIFGEEYYFTEDHFEFKITD